MDAPTNKQLKPGASGINKTTVVSNLRYGLSVVGLDV